MKPSGTGSPRGRERLVLAEIARLAAEDLELRPMLQRVSDLVAARFGCEFVALVRVDREPARFVCEALTTSLPTEVHVGYGRELGSGVVGRVALTGEPVVLDDVALDPQYVETLPGARSELCVPVRQHGAVLAVLNLESPRRAAFRGRLPLFLEVADQISGAVASALWLEASRRRTAHLEILAELSRRALAVEDLDDRLARVVEFLRERLDLELVALLVADERGRVWRHRAIASLRAGELERRATWPTSSGVVGRAMRTGEPQLVLDVASDPDYLAIDRVSACEFVVPIRIRDRLRAALNIEAADRARLDSESLALYRAVAEQVVGPIELGLVHRQLRLANRRLERLSREDGLTALANRREFARTLDLEWRRCERLGLPVALALLDLDRFKEYNDALGHPAGDRCLRQVAELLRGAAQRASDLASRYGGEEFVLLLPGTELDAAVKLVEAVRVQLGRRALAHPKSPTGAVTLSAGVAARIPAPGHAASELIALADEALYRAKREGRDRVATSD